MSTSTPRTKFPGLRTAVLGMTFLSGSAALVYQIVWIRGMTTVFGNSSLAVSAVVSAFMAGMALGSFVTGRFIDRRTVSLLKTYAVLEAGIAAGALLFPVLLSLGMRVYTAMYSGVSANSIALNLSRFILGGGLVLLPTFLMGGTLPVLSKLFGQYGISIRRGFSVLYGINTLGSVLGCILCGFVLLRFFGMRVSVYMAVAANLAVAAVAFAMSRRENAIAAEPSSTEANDKALDNECIAGRQTVWPVVLAVGLGGFSALAYEVLWSRLLTLTLGNTVYSFTTVLASFLGGIALGSLVYRTALSRAKHQALVLAAVQCAIALLACIAPLVFAATHYRLYHEENIALAMILNGLFLLVLTTLIGIALPMAVHICRKGRSREGESVGDIYAVSTVGSILGSFAAGFILLPALGLMQSITLAATLNVAAGGLVLAVVFRSWNYRTAVAGAVVLVGAAIKVSTRESLVASIHNRIQPGTRLVYYKEGVAANVAVYDFYRNGYIDLYLNSSEEASTRLWHVQLFKLLGALPVLVHDSPDNACMIAFGSGMSAGACAQLVDSLDVVELNPDIDSVAAIFSEENLDVLHNPKVNFIFNDGRNHLLLTPKRYSVIISDATNPRSFDSWTLYTREFYELCRDRLKPGGVFCQWVPILLPRDALKVILNTFRTVFPHMSFWWIHGSSQCLMLGTPERLSFDYTDLSRKLPVILDSIGLDDYGVHGPEKFLSFFGIGEDGLATALAETERISTDDLPYSQFLGLAGREGALQGLDLVGHLHTAGIYLSGLEGPARDSVRQTLDCYLTLSRHLDRSFLMTQSAEARTAELYARIARLEDDQNVASALSYDRIRRQYFEKRLENHPDDAFGHGVLGYIYYKKRRYGEAIAKLERAVSLNPGLVPAYRPLVLSLISSDHFERAAELIGRLLQPGAPPALAAFARGAHRLLNVSQRLSAAPGDSTLYLAVSGAYLNLDEPVYAFEAAKAAYNAGVRDLLVYSQLGGLYEIAGAVESAQSLYLEGLARFPNHQGLAAKVRELATRRK
ncbi:MAG: tetratricopeptide repeat protein [Chitinivibrionales bacterium]|nr:tetratricopeptide repeat protein [Chitinivibrionales bacterium]MBD3395860.1 tetratricopeptide repeat protein [Chitinivibrionales bacterium]